MCAAPDRKLERRRRWQRKQLAILFQSGSVLVASGDAPNQHQVRQIVSVSLKSDGMAHVRVEHSNPWSWDDVIDEAKHTFPSFDAALAWLETECGVHWSHLHEPGEPPAGGLPPQ